MKVLLTLEPHFFPFLVRVIPEALKNLPHQPCPTWPLASGGAHTVSICVPVYWCQSCCYCWLLIFLQAHIFHPHQSSHCAKHWDTHEGGTTCPTSPNFLPYPSPEESAILFLSFSFLFSVSSKLLKRVKLLSQIASQIHPFTSLMLIWYSFSFSLTLENSILLSTTKQMILKASWIVSPRIWSLEWS